MQNTQEIVKSTQAGTPSAGEDATYNHVVKYTSFLGLVQVLSMLVSVVRNKLSALWLGAAGIGLSSLYLNFTTFLSNVSGLGISFSSVKYMSELYGSGSREQMERFAAVVRTWSVWTGLLGMAACMLCAPLVRWLAPLVGAESWAGESPVVTLCLLSPMLLFMAVTGGEMALLKALRRLKRVAVISVFGALAALLLTVPFYYAWGIRGVVPGLVCSTAGVMAVHLWFSLQVLPWRVSLLNREYFRQGWNMVRLGVPFVVAGMANTATGLGVMMFIAGAGSLADAGLYGMGYNLVMVYVATFFTAIDSDYFPRLSTLHTDRERMNVAVNRQIKVCLLLITPLLILFVLCMPMVVYVLYSREFLPIVGMAVWASLHMFFKAMTLPVAYLSLARGDALVYFAMEVAYDVALALLVIGTYLAWGIPGTGIALALAGVFDWLLVGLVYSRRYGFRPDRSLWSVAALQFVCMAIAVALGLQSEVLPKVVLGGGVLLCSVLLSVGVLRCEVTFFSTWKAKLQRWRAR